MRLLVPTPPFRDPRWYSRLPLRAFLTSTSHYLVPGSFAPSDRGTFSSLLYLEDPAVLCKLASLKTQLDDFCCDTNTGVISGTTFLVLSLHSQHPEYFVYEIHYCLLSIWRMDHVLYFSVHIYRKLRTWVFLGLFY